ncbi:MAG: ABC transporter ATP-binding protein [Alphaproteobacteria bacterium]
MSAARGKSAAEPLLDVHELSVAFQSGGERRTVVDRVSFSLEKGRTLALVGESGSGKSTTALSIPQLLPYPAASHPGGSIRFLGREMVGADDDALLAIRGNRVGMIFQEPMTSLNPLHTIEKQVSEVLQIHRKLPPKEARPRVLELLHRVGLQNAESRLDAYPHQLSGGQRQRVMIATALANRPDLLIADEPTTALDVTIQAQILELLKDIQAELGMAMLLITHDLGIVRRMTDHVCVMKDGKIVERGPIARVFDAPEHDYTKHLLDAEPSGRPSAFPEEAPPVMAADDLKVWFPIKRGFLQRTVDHVKAVDGLSLTVRAGETVGVVGESGSGKTTLGMALLRLVSSKGGITFEGRSLQELNSRRMRPLRRELQVVFQDPYGSLSPRMSVGDIIAEGLDVHGMAPQKEERRALISEALEEVGLPPEAQDRYPHEFSGGQRQRIAIARAMALKPRFVMLDEPTSALDMSVQAQIVELLRRLQDKHGLAYLFISHDLKVVRALSHHVVVMKDGRVVEQGPADVIFDNPQEDYTKALMAAAFELKARAS